MAADENVTAENDDLKARFKEALARKQSHDRGVEQRGHPKEKGHETHGPLGGPKMYRRKAGGGA